MFAIKTFTACAAGALIVTPGPALAQTSSANQPTQEDRVGAILGTLFGDGLGVSTSIERQWAAGRRPLATQRLQFNARINADVRSGSLTQANGTRVMAEYDQLVALETRYGADNRFTTQERTVLGDRYGDLTQALTEGGYADDGGPAVLDNRTRLANVDRALNSSGLGVAAKSQVRVELGDLTRLAAAYARATPTSEERSYLERRIVNLETRARVRR